MEWYKVKLLGQGSYGLVTLAVNLEDPTLPPIAIKSSRMKHSYSLRKEKRILERLEGSPHVLMFLADTQSFDPQLGLVYDLLLEYAAGGSLSHMIRKRGGCLPEYEVQEYTRMILKGLCAIHDKGYVHCDLKPDNILVVPCQDGTNCLKIADFGLTKEPGEEMLYGDSFVLRFRGTPLYMSPDSFLFGEIDCKLDIWSLGCVVVEMLTGQRAMQWFGDGGNLASKYAFIKQEPNIPESVSDMSKDFLKKCFARNPRERWTAEMLLNHPYVLPSDLNMSTPRWCSFASNSLQFIDSPDEIKQAIQPHGHDKKQLQGKLVV